MITKALALVGLLVVVAWLVTLGPRAVDMVCVAIIAGGGYYLLRALQRDFFGKRSIRELREWALEDGNSVEVQPDDGSSDTETMVELSALLAKLSKMEGMP